MSPVKRTSAIWRRLRFAIEIGRHDPALLRDYAGWFFSGRREVRGPAATGVAPPSISPEQARDLLVERYGEWDPGPAYAELEARTLDDAARHGGGAVMAGDSALGLLAYWVVRAVRPRTVVETGVATGVTSAHLLAALRDNGSGTLESIDLPPTDMLADGTVGAAIPEAWKADWRYRWGSARRLLPGVLERAEPGPLVFVHDSDHSYEHMAWEITTAWERLRPGDALISDDVHFHDAFVATAAALGARPQLVTQAEKRGTTGLLFR